MNHYIRRQKYDDRIQPFIHKAIIKVLIGQRRVGKSYLLEQVRDTILATEQRVNCIYIDKESTEFTHILTASDLSDYIQDKAVLDEQTLNCLMIDEIQEIPAFETSIRAFGSKPNFDVYITGSNSELLSGELATRLSGRYIEIPVYSLDFEEFLQFHILEGNVESLDLYLRYGGMPFLRNLELKDDQVFEYLKNVFASILYRDIITRYNIRNVNFLDRLVRFTADNIGNILNAKKISDYLKSQRVQISVNSVLDYLSYLVSSQIIMPVKRIDLKGKRIFDIGEKFYFQDLGIRNALAGYRVSDIGKLMENAVFNHLVGNGYQVYTGDWQQREIDFVAEKNNERVYIQVTYRLIEPATFEREFGNLLYIEDNYPKIVVSMDSFAGSNTYKGIEHWSLLQFLKNFK